VVESVLYVTITLIQFSL